MTSDDIARAIRARVAVLFELELGDAEWPIDHDYMDAAVTLGDHELDSLDLVEVMMVLEDELDVRLIDAEEMRELSSLSKVGVALEARADVGLLERFCARWGDPVGVR